MHLLSLGSVAEALLRIREPGPAGEPYGAGAAAWRGLPTMPQGPAPWSADPSAPAAARKLR